MGKVVVAAFALLAAAGCYPSSHVVLQGPFQRQGDGWDLTLTKVEDGPNLIDVHSRLFAPREGERFIWVFIELHNPSRDRRKFNFDRCDMDLGDKDIVPAFIALDWIGGPGGAPREPLVFADETISRRLVFAYPQDRSPKRFRCLPITIPMPQF